MKQILGAHFNLLNMILRFPGILPPANMKTTKIFAHHGIFIPARPYPLQSRPLFSRSRLFPILPFLLCRPSISRFPSSTEPQEPRPRASAGGHSLGLALPRRACLGGRTPPRPRLLQTPCSGRTPAIVGAGSGSARGPPQLARERHRRLPGQGALVLRHEGFPSACEGRLFAHSRWRLLLRRRLAEGLACLHVEREPPPQSDHATAAAVGNAVEDAEAVLAEATEDTLEEEEEEVPAPAPPSPSPVIARESRRHLFFLNFLSRSRYLLSFLGSTRLLMSDGITAVPCVLEEDELIHGISGGQKKRLTIERRWSAQPKVLFMDEISTGLYSSFTFQIVKCIQQIVHQGEITILHPGDVASTCVEGQIVY
ncbi:unnamed protein product [Urochloa humidicola]